MPLNVHWLSNKRYTECGATISVEMLMIFNSLNLLTYTHTLTHIQGAYYAYWRQTINLACGANDPTNNSYEMQQIIMATWVYYVSKIIDLLDTVIRKCCIMPVTFGHIHSILWNKVHFITYSNQLNLCLQVFFVLRKKNNQITFLHVYHHGGMVLATFIYFKFLSGKKK